MLDLRVFNKIRAKGQSLGFELLGVTSDFKVSHAEYFTSWLENKKHGEMSWLERNTDKRLDPSALFDGTKSALVVACSYNHEPTERDHKIARYAHGQDYHLWMKEKLECLAQFIKNEIVPDFAWRSFVDTGPILERDLAAKAGLGWIGKNTCLINPEQGSYVFLGVILCNLEFGTFALQTDLCGSCRLCLDACPTQALTPYQLDASKCLAYHNIEKRGPRDSRFAESFGEWLVGCDICQEICPHNHHAPETGNANWRKSFDDYEVATLKDWALLSAEAYKEKFKDSAISRIKFEDIKRNVEIVLNRK